MDVARLKYEIDSTQASRAGQNLDRMRRSAADAERAQKGLGGQTARTGNSMGRFTKAAVAVDAANDNVASSTRLVGREFGVTSRAFTSLRSNIVSGAAIIGASVLAAFSVSPLFEFKDALAEVSTLVDTTTFDMEALEASALRQAAAFGSSPAAQTKAFYQIISAGAGSALEATNLLTAANKLAVGGVTDVTTAADGLTSVLNAYGNDVEGATAVSDALFVAMRAGKTTVGELSRSLGKVAPLAAQSGVEFDALLAAVSALTKGGISTTESFTGMRAILAAVAKPTVEAQKQAKKLGLEFNSAGLKSKGLADFLDELVKKTGGSTEQLALLFGGVEALVPILALSGRAGDDFNKVLDQMARKTAETEEAVRKMEQSPGFQAGRVWAALQVEVLGLSSSMSGPLVTALKAIADHMHLIVLSVAIFTGGHLVAALIPVIANIAALTAGMGAATIAARTLSIAMAFVGGPIGLAFTVLAGAVLYLYNAMETTSGGAKQFTKAIDENERSLNGAKGASVGYLNALAAQIEIQKTAAQTAFLEARAQYAAARAKTEALKSQFSSFGLDPNDSLAARLAQEQADKINEKSLELSEAYNKLVEQSDQVTGLLENLNTGSNGNSGTPPLLTTSEGKASPLDDLARETQALRDQELALHMAQREAIVFLKVKETLAAFISQGIIPTESETEAIRNQAEAYADASLSIDKTTKAKQAYTDSLEASKENVKSFFSDFKSGLQEGQSFWQSFSDAATKALDRITDKLLNEVLDALFQVNSAGSGGGGSLIGSLVPALFGLPGFMTGGYTGDARKHKQQELSMVKSLLPTHKPPENTGRNWRP